MTPLECLRANPLLSMLPEAELGKLCKRAVTRRWKKNEVLFRKGDACDGMHGVISGCIITVMESENGGSQSIGTYGPGGHVAMLGLFDGGVRHVTAIAHEDSCTLVLPRRDFTAAVASRPELKDRLIGMLCQEVR